MTSKIDVALSNYRKALSNLEKFIQMPIQNERDKAGIIQAFEYTYECAWKSIQKKAEPHNLQIGSPRQAFQAAFQLGWISEPDHRSWLKMVDDRNLTSHTYRVELADQVLSAIINEHLAQLRTMLSKLSG